MKVKICGITNFEDALEACQMGADALGFVFYEKSPRFIEVAKVKEISKLLPPFVKKVALFVNQEPSYIDSVCKKCGMDLAQIHFEASMEFFDKLQTPYIKVIRAKSKDDILTIKDEYVLVDAYVDSYGGEGKRVALEWFDGIDCSKMILAGGLDSNNIQEVKKYNFYGVDVSSGVEASKGKKDLKKLKTFIQNSKN